VGIFSGCFVVVLSLVWLLSFLTKEQSYEDGLKRAKGGRLQALGVNNATGGKEAKAAKRQAKGQQDKPAKGTKAKQHRKDEDGGGEEQPSKKAMKKQRQKAAAAAAAAAVAAAEEASNPELDEVVATTQPVDDVEVETIEVSSSESEEPVELGQEDLEASPAETEVTAPVAEPVEEPVEAPLTAAVTLTAAGKAKAKKEAAAAPAKPTKMTIEEVETAEVTQEPEPVAAAEEQRVPVVEPIVVKEEAALLYEEKVQGTGTGTSTPAQSTPVSGNRQNRKKQRGGGGGGGSQPAAPMQPQDLMTAVRKTNFDEDELQNLIDILLNKQQNAPTGVNGSWVDPQTKELKELQRAVQEKDAQLDTQKYQVEQLTGRYQQIQREIAEAKQREQRIKNDFQGQISVLERGKMEAEQAFANLNHRQSYDISNLTQQNHELVRQIQELNSHVAVFRSRPAPEDVKAELEQAHSNQLNELHSQLSHRTNELASMKQQVQELQSKMQGSEGAKDAMSIELSKAKEQAISLEQQCSVLQQNNQNQAELHSRIEELSNDKGSLEQKYDEVRTQLKSTDDQLTATKAELEKKMSEWEEEKVALKTSVSQISFNGQASQEDHEKKEEEFVAKFNQVLKEKEALVQKISNDQEQIQNKSSEADNLRNELETIKGQLSDATASLDQQRVKNDDEKSSAVKQTEDKFVSFLTRVFADVDFKAEESQWKDSVEAQMKALRQPPPPPAPPAEDNSSNEEIEKLEKQVNHYKSSLQETESLLHKLQASVEAEEAKWKQSLSDQQKELEALKEQNAKMESCVQSAEEV